MKAFASLLLLFAVEAHAALEFKPHPITRRDGSSIEAELAMLTVPVRHAVDKGPSFELAVVRLRSTSRTPGDPIVYLAGGPGQAATGAAGSPAIGALREVADVLLLDQRGTGMSKVRLTCSMPGPPPGAVAFADERAMTAGAIQFIRGCASDWKRRGVDVGAFNTEESADDVESLRSALGVQKLTLVGFSYGTHLGLSVIRRHGKRISRAVLIGTEGPDDTYKTPETLDLQLARLSLLATGTDALVRAYDRIAQKLETRPVTVAVRLTAEGNPVDVTVSRFGLERIIVQDLGDSNDFVLFPALFEMLEKDDTSLLARYVEKRYRGLSATISLMSVAMDCASGASPERLAAIARQAPASRFRRTNYPFPALCAALDVHDLGDDFRAPVVSDVPTLFVSGTFDSNTPPYQAERVRWGFSNARHLIVTYAGHEDMDRNPDVGKVIVDFVRGKEVKDGTIELPRPKFLSVEEVTRQSNRRVFGSADDR